MKKYCIAVLAGMLSCISCNSPFEHFVNKHIIYEGTIEASPYKAFESSKEITMELWFPTKDFIYGYWQEKGSKNKYYVKGSFYSLRSHYGKEAKKKRKEDKQTYSLISGTLLRLEEMSKELAGYRIWLSEYYDEMYDNATGNCFYVFNFENQKLQGTYWSLSAPANYSFNTVFHLKGSQK